MRPRCSSSGLVLVALCWALSACASVSGRQSPKFGSEARLRVAQAAEESGDYALAESMYASAAKAAPTDASLQLRYADVLVRRGDVEQAKSWLIRHLNTVTDQSELRRALGAVYVMGGEPQNAIVEFDKILATHPDDMRAVVDKAVALDLLGRHAEAQHLYKQALATSPDDSVVINDLALSVALQGRTQDAATLLRPLEHAEDILPRIRNNIDIVRKANGGADIPREAEQDAGLDEQIKQLAQAVRRQEAGTPAQP